MRLSLASFSVGLIACYFHGNWLLSQSYLTFLAFGLTASLSAVSAASILRLNLIVRPLIAIGFASFGVAFANFSINAQLNQTASLTPGIVILEGHICSLPVQGKYAYRQHFCVSSSVENQEFANSKIVVSVPSKFELHASPGCQQIQINYEKPRAWVNPEGFDYEKHLFARKILGFGKLRGSPANCSDQLSAQENLFAHYHYWRYELSQQLDLQLRDIEQAHLIRALVLGDRGGFDRQLATVLSESGTQHLVAISGLHIGVVVGLVYLLCPFNRYRAFPAMLAGGLYVLMAGAPVSSVRAWLMCLSWFIARAGLKRARYSDIFLVAVALVLVLNPHSVLESAFWFSFAAVGLIFMLLAIYPESVNSPFGSALVFQAVLTTGLFPLYLAFGIGIGASFLICNLIAVPWFSLVIVPMALLSSLLAILEFPLAELGLQILDHLLLFFVSFFEASIGVLPQFHISHTSSLTLAALILFLALLVLTARIRLFAVYAVVLLGLLLIFGFKSDEERQEFVVFDVGQGLATLTRSRHSSWIYDVGPAFERFSAAQSVLIPFLRSQKLIDEVDGIILSHADWDHASSIGDVLRHRKPLATVSGEHDRLHTLYDPDRLFAECRQQVLVAEPSFRIEILFPIGIQGANHYESSNQRSCVARVILDDLSILIMGDLEGEAERDFLSLYKGDLKSDILIAGHHGSKNATSYALLKRVRPSWVIFSSGFNNRFGHPHVDILNKVESFGAVSMETSRSGAILFRKDKGKHWQIIEQRKADPPFWRQP